MQSPLRTPRRGSGLPERLGACALLAACSLAGLAPASAQTGPAANGTIDDTRAVLAKWVEMRRVISKEKRDWQLGREMLQDRIALVQREIDSLHKQISDAETSISDTDKKSAELVQQNESLKQAASALQDTVVALEARTRTLVGRLPDPIRELVKPLSQRLPDDPQETKLSLSERFMNVVGVLNAVTKFNREVSVTSELRTLPDGTTAEVATLYAGLGQAWYVSGDGKAAGVGVATPEGWSWTPANESAAAIADAIATLKNEQVAAFSRLPVRIDEETSQP